MSAPLIGALKSQTSLEEQKQSAESPGDTSPCKTQKLDDNHKSANTQSYTNPPKSKVH